MSLRRGVAQAATAASLILLGLGCAEKSKTNAKDPNQNNIYVMGYNVENLFDLEHTVENSVDKNDWQYLPMNYPGKLEGCRRANTNKNGELHERYYGYCITTDWNQEKLTTKLETIKKVVLHSGRTPDILGVSEIENDNVANQLAGVLGYEKFIITTSPDSRGIDVALFYLPQKVELVQVYEHEMLPPRYNGKGTRNALVGVFKMKNGPENELLAMSMNHWPSQGNTDEVRLEVAKEVMMVLETMKSAYEAEGITLKIVMLGDFNVINSDIPHAFEDGLFSSENWNVKVSDVEELHNQMVKVHDNPPGTYYYGTDETWNKLDRFFVSEDLKDSDENSGLRLDAYSYDIVVQDWMTYDFETTLEKSGVVQTLKVPNRFKHYNDDLNELGVSDHFPVEMKIYFKK